MVTETQKKIILHQQPQGIPSDDDFKIIDDTVPKIDQNEILIKTKYFSVDPGMRGRLGTGASYSKTLNVEVGEELPAYALGEVVESNHQQFDRGDTVIGELWWSEYSVTDNRSISKVDLPSDVPETAGLSVLGLTGRAAYFGLLDVGHPIPGDTVVVSAAAGAVGSIVGQIAALCDCHVVGITGSDEKADYLTDSLNFDSAINYNQEEDLAARIRSECPNGVDIYFDNVGGSIRDSVVENLCTRARIVVCGKISLYNEDPVPLGKRLMHQRKRIKEEGFIIHDYSPRYSEAVDRLIKWLSEDKISYRVSVAEGIENAPKAFIGLFEGENIGKQLVAI